MRPTFTPDYSKSKQTSRFAKEIMKPHLCHATEIRSHAQESLNLEVEQVDKRPTKWILSLMTGQMSYGGRLLALPHDREIKDLIFFYT